MAAILSQPQCVKSLSPGMIRAQANMACHPTIVKTITWTMQNELNIVNCKQTPWKWPIGTEHILGYIFILKMSVQNCNEHSLKLAFGEMMHQDFFNQLYIWQVLTQLCWGDTCQIWNWYLVWIKYFNVMEKLKNGTLVNPNPGHHCLG